VTITNERRRKELQEQAAARAHTAQAIDNSKEAARKLSESRTHTGAASSASHQATANPSEPMRLDSVHRFEQSPLYNRGRMGGSAGSAARYDQSSNLVPTRAPLQPTTNCAAARDTNREYLTWEETPAWSAPIARQATQQAIRAQPREAPIITSAEKTSKLSCKLAEEHESEETIDNFTAPLIRAPQCCVCLEYNANHVIIPCGHICVCEQDIQHIIKKPIPKCPTCMQVIKTYSRVFIN
jgi:hypothetical protein